MLLPVETKLWGQSYTKNVWFTLPFSHKFRHSHAVYTLKKAKDVPALKAISQNLMHSNLSITDSVYGILSDGDTKKEIQALGPLSEKQQ